MTAGGFLWKIRKKTYESKVFLLERMKFFDKMVKERVLFRKKSEKKGIFRIFKSKVWCNFDRIDIFLTKYGLVSRRFFIQ